VVPYDADYIAQKEEVLQSLGIRALRIKVEPGDWTLDSQSADPPAV